MSKEIIEKVREDTLLKDEEIDSIVEPLHEGEHYPWNPEEHKAVAQAQQDRILSHPNIFIGELPSAREISNQLAFLLGFYGGSRIYENYPDNFNKKMGFIGSRLESWLQERLRRS